jgi:hypothetical protein
MPNEKIIVRVSPVTAVIFSIIFSPAIIIGLVKVFEYQQIGGGFAFCALPIFFIYWICSPTVSLEDKTLTYSIGFFARRSINLESATRVEVTARPTPVLKLFQGHSKHIEFIIKPFSKTGVTFILHYIKSHAPNAQFDSISSDLEHGDFVSVTREAMRLQNWLQFFSTVAGSSFLVAFSQAKIHSTPLTIGIIIIAALALVIMASRKK